MILVIFVLSSMAFVALEGASLVNIQPFQLPLKWHYTSKGTDFAMKGGFVEEIGNVLRLGNVDASEHGKAEYTIRLTTSLVTSQKVEGYLYISAHPFTRVNGSSTFVNFNGYSMALTLGEPWRLGQGTTFFRHSIEPIPQVLGTYGSFIRLDIPQEYLSPIANVRLSVPARVEWFVENIVTELEVKHSNQTPTRVEPDSRLALILIIASLLIILTFWSPSGARLMVVGGLSVRLLAAGFSEDLFDMEVYEQYIRLYHEEGLVNLGYWIYGPLLLVTLFLAAWPSYALSIPPTSGLMNLLIKLPIISADGAVYKCLTRGL